MKYAICYDGPGRLRLRLGQHAFSEKEGWGIASLLRQKSGVERVRTCAQNGSILIYYGKDIAKETLLNTVGKLRRADIPKVEPTEDLSASSAFPVAWTAKPAPWAHECKCVGCGSYWRFHAEAFFLLGIVYYVPAVLL